MKMLTVGTRGSELALWQTRHVMGLLAEANPGLRWKEKVIKTSGDKILDVALSRIGDKGLFTREIEYELLRGNIDLAVHSMKDLPTALPEGLAIGAAVRRENPGDAMVSGNGCTLEELPPGALVGTSSLRRQAQLLQIRPDVRIIELRGNVGTRLRRLREGKVDAVILAWAGIIRLGCGGLVPCDLGFVPAAGQGALGIEVRAGDHDLIELLQTVNDSVTSREVRAERTFLAALEGGCQVPIGVLARELGGRMEMEGLVSDLKGERVIRHRLVNGGGEPEELGRRLAGEMLDLGAGSILQEIRIQESNDVPR